MLRVRVCTGVNCAMYGGNGLYRAMEKALTDLGLMDQVELLSAHCLGSCESGPCVRIGGEKHVHVSEVDVMDLIRDEIMPQLG